MRYHLIIPADLKPAPTQDEIMVAEALSQFFKSDIEFVKRSISHTPDLRVCRFNQFWEIKNIRGNSTKTIENTLRSAQYQSENIIISLSRTPMNLSQATGRVKQALKRGHIRAKRIIILSKSKKVVVAK